MRRATAFPGSRAAPCRWRCSGRGDYPRLIGRLAFPSLIVQALAPSAGALLIVHYGPDVTIAVLTVFAAANVVIIGILWRTCRERR